MSRLLRGITSNHHGYFYCLNCFYCSFSTKNRLKKNKELRNKRDHCHIEMPKEDEKILKYEYGEKSLKALYVIELDIECILKKSIHVKIIQKKLPQREKLSINLQPGQCLRNVHLI